MSATQRTTSRRIASHRIATRQELNHATKLRDQRSDQAACGYVHSYADKERNVVRQSESYAWLSVGAETSTYQSAKRIAERDHRVYIESVRGFGFVRGDGSDMLKSAGAITQRIRRAAKRGSRRISLAMEQNLTRDEHQRAAELYSRFQIIGTTALMARARSNHKQSDPLPLSD